MIHGRLNGLYDAWYRLRFGIAVGCIVALGLSSWLARGAVRPLGRTLAVEAPRAAGGHAFITRLSRTDLSADRRPVDSVLYEIRTERGAAAFSRLDERWNWSLAYRNLRARFLARRPDWASEQRRVIGPGNQVHQEIRDQGRGRYSIWKGELLFSASDNSSPVANGRRYELFIPYFSPGVIALIAVGLRGLGLTVLTLTIIRTLGERAVFRRVLANTLPGLFVSAVVVFLAGAGFELYQRRVNKAFPIVEWPTRFDSVAGYVFEPGAEVWWTNHVDFWTRERVNSLGFLDNEPVLPKPPGRFRILIVGDSFVEAAQVQNHAKVQTVLARMLADRFGAGKFDVVAFGHSGTGQANQLGFYERFGRQVAPDLVLLVAVSNDFANNSPILEAVRNGWQPYDTPRRFIERAGDGFKRITPREDWAQRKLPGDDSLGYFNALRLNPEFAPRLQGWAGPIDQDMDAVFWRRELPPVFHEAIALTRQALEEWKALGMRDGFEVVVVGTENLTREVRNDVEEGTLYLDRFRAVSAQAGLPFLDLYPFFSTRPDRWSAYWSQDTHWSSTGHQWAGEALFTYLIGSGFLPESAK